MKRGTKFKTKSPLLRTLVTVDEDQVRALEFGSKRDSSSLIVLVESTQIRFGEEANARLGAKLTNLKIAVASSNITDEDSIASRRDRHQKGRNTSNQLLKLLSRPKNLLSSFVPHILTKQLVLKRPHNLMTTINLKGPPSGKMQPRSKSTTIHNQSKSHSQHRPIKPILNQPAFALETIHLRTLLLPPMPLGPIQQPGMRHRQIVFLRGFPSPQLMPHPLPAHLPFMFGPHLNDYSDDEKAESAIDEDEDETEMGLNQVDQLIKNELETRTNLNEQIVNGLSSDRPMHQQVNGTMVQQDNGRVYKSSNIGPTAGPRLETTTVWPGKVQEHSLLTDSSRPLDELTTAMNLIPSDSTETWLPTDSTQTSTDYIGQSQRQSHSNSSSQAAFDASEHELRSPALYQKPPVEGKSPGELARWMPSNGSVVSGESFLPSALETIVQLKQSNSANLSSSSTRRNEDGWQRQKNHKSPLIPLLATSFADTVPSGQQQLTQTRPKEPIILKDSGRQRQFRVDLGNPVARERNLHVQPGQMATDEENNRLHLEDDKSDLSNRLKAFPMDHHHHHHQQQQQQKQPFNRKVALPSSADGPTIVLDETLRKLRETRTKIRELQAKLNITYKSERATSGGGGQHQPATSIMTASDSKKTVMMQDRVSTEGKSMYDDDNENDSESGADDSRDEVASTSEDPNEADWPPTRGVQPSDAPRSEKEWWLSTTAAPSPKPANVASIGEPLVIDENGGLSKGLRGFELIRPSLVKSQQTMNLPMGMYHGNGGPLRAPVQLAASAFGRTATRVVEAARGPSTGRRWSAPGLVPPPSPNSASPSDTNPTSAPIILTSMITVGQTELKPTTPVPRLNRSDISAGNQSTGGLQTIPVGLQPHKPSGADRTNIGNQPGESSIVMVPIGNRPTFALDPLLSHSGKPDQTSLAKTVIRESLNDNGANQNDRLRPMQMIVDSKQPATSVDELRLSIPRQQQVRQLDENSDGKNESHLRPVGVVVTAGSPEDKEAARMHKSELTLQVARKPMIVVATSAPANTSAARNGLTGESDAKSGSARSRKLNATQISVESFDLNGVKADADQTADKDSSRRSANRHGNLISHLFNGLLDKLTDRPPAKQHDAHPTEQRELSLSDAQTDQNGLLSGSNPSRLTTERVLQVLIGVSCGIVLLCLCVILVAVRRHTIGGNRKSRRAIVGCPIEHNSLQPSPTQLDIWRRFGLAANDNRFQHNKLILDGTMRNVSLQAKHLQQNVQQLGQHKGQTSSSGAPLPLFNRSCCHCVNCSESWLFRDSNNQEAPDGKHSRRSDPNLCSSGFYHPAPRGKLPFGAASSVNKLLDQTSSADMPVSQEHQPGFNLLSLADGAKHSTFANMAADSRVPIGGTRMRMMSAIDEHQSSGGSFDLGDVSGHINCACKQHHSTDHEVEPDCRSYLRRMCELHSHSMADMKPDQVGCPDGVAFGKSCRQCACGQDEISHGGHEDNCPEQSRRAGCKLCVACKLDYDDDDDEEQALNCGHDEEAKSANNNCWTESINVAKIVQHQRTTSAKLTCTASDGNCMTTECNAKGCCKLRAKLAPSSSAVHNNDTKCSKQAMISLEGLSNNCAKSGAGLLQPAGSSQSNCFAQPTNGFRRIAQRFEEFSSKGVASGREGDKSRLPVEYEPPGRCPQHETRELQSVKRQLGRLSVLTKPLSLAATIPRKLRQSLIGQSKQQHFM